MKRSIWVFPVLLAGVVFSCVEQARAQSLDEETLDRVKLAAVMVRTAASKNREGDDPQGTGSGFFVNATGLCITNNHVVDPGHKKSSQEKFDLKGRLNRLVWTVVRESGTDNEEGYKADVLYQNEQADIAVLQVKNEDGEFLDTPDGFLTFLPTSDVSPGLKAFCFGFPGGDRLKTTKEFPPVRLSSGNIVNIPRTTSGRIRMIETDVLANPGNSGGPFVNETGQLIGVLTLGSQTESRTNTTMLVPGDLVQEMIATAFNRGKVPAGVDIDPFYDLFVDGSRVWKLPLLERKANLDCLTVDSDTRVCGKVAQKTIKWPSPLGDIEVPISAMAYMRKDDRHAMAFIDGGDRFPFDPSEVTIKFAPEGGQPIDIDLDDVDAISFRRPTAPPKLPTGTALVLKGRDYNVSLQEITGELKIDSGSILGELKVQAADVKRIVEEDLDRVFYTKSGSRLAGEVAPHKLRGILAWSGSPITFTYEDEEVNNIEIRPINYREEVLDSELSLVASLETSDPRLVNIAELLDHNLFVEAKPFIDELIEGRAFRDLSSEKKNQLRFLNGEYLIRSGQFAAAADAFKKVRSAKVESIAWNARARLAILNRYENGQYNGEPVSEPRVFKLAARALAEELADKGAIGVESVEDSKPDSRGDYLKILKRSKSTEEILQIANSLTTGSSEEYIVYLWRITAQAHANEIQRLARQQRDFQEQLTRPGPGGRPLVAAQRRQLDRKITQLTRDIGTAQEAEAILRGKIEEAGFIIDDPDNLARRD